MTLQTLTGPDARSPWRARWTGRSETWQARADRPPSTGRFACLQLERSFFASCAPRRDAGALQLACSQVASVSTRAPRRRPGTRSQVASVSTNAPRRRPGTRARPHGGPRGPGPRNSGPGARPRIPSRRWSLPPSRTAQKPSSESVSTLRRFLDRGLKQELKPIPEAMTHGMYLI